MTNERTIDEIMEEVFLSQELAFNWGSKKCTAEDTYAQDVIVRNGITAALATKDAEIERLMVRLTETEGERDAARSILDATADRLGRQPAKPEPGEWVEWKGGDCPIADGVMFSARFRDGTITNCYQRASEYRWHHGGGDLSVPEADIVAYRIIP